MITEKEGFDKIQLMMSDQGYAMTHNYKIRYDKGAYSIILCPHQRNYHVFDIKHMYDTIGVENITINNIWFLLLYRIIFSRI